MKIFWSLLLLLISSFAMAQVAAPVSPASSGVMGWVTAHGGFQAAVLLLVFSANAILSGVRKALANWDGIPEGQDGPPDFKVLNFLNKACYWAGKIVDYMQGNVKH